MRGRFIRGRFRIYNLRQVLDTIQIYESHWLPGLLFVTDFEKAFHKVQRWFIKQCLCYFNITGDLIKWFETLYNHPPS